MKKFFTIIIPIVIFFKLFFYLGHNINIPMSMDVVIALIVANIAKKIIGGIADKMSVMRENQR